MAAQFHSSRSRPGESKKISGEENFKISGHFSTDKTMQTC